MHLEERELRVYSDLLVRRDHLDLPDPMDFLDHREQLDNQDPLGYLDLRDFEVPKGQ